MTKKYVLTGGPGLGKSTTLELAKGKGLYLMNEVATYIIKAELQKPESEQIVPWKDPYNFQEKVFRTQKEWEAEIPQGIEKALLDRGTIDNLAYLKLNNLEDTKLYKEITEHARKTRYEKIFLLDPLPTKEETEIRRDTAEAEKIYKLIKEEYEKLGYKLERIPLLAPKERTEYILKRTN